jgi:adenosylcobinamide kinase/adenosylcobinamide-phosphate guanylyltransferase
MTAPDLTLILGGARSGKSAYAERLAAASAGAVHYIATARRDADDAEFGARIAHHRVRRPMHWRLTEAGADLAAALRAADAPGGCALVDCLTLCLAGLLCPGEGPADAGWQARIDALDDALANARGRVIVVSNEIGLGVVPLGAQTRHYVDTLGRLNQRIAARSARVFFVAAGLPLALK